MSETFIGAKVALHAGDCLAVLPTLVADSIDSCVTDPPYHLASIVKRFGADNAAPAKVGKTGAYARASAGFMGKQWDGGDVAFQVETWRQVLRVLKPGAYLLAFGGTRTYHRMVCAIEDAGFEIRDSIQWLYGSGFPKSHDVSKAIDKAAGVKGSFGDPKSAEHVRFTKGDTNSERVHEGWKRPWMDDPEAVDRTGRRYLPASEQARAFDGWGTALKPACEPIVLARKPLIGTVAQNVLKWGTGAMNMDGCRVGTEERHNPSAQRNEIYGQFQGAESEGRTAIGRWPANVIHDGSEEVVGAFPETDGVVGALHDPNGSLGYHGGAQGVYRKGTPDSGSAARFFYTAKADANDRIGSKHPTVKPVDLIQYLCRLVTPPKGLILDPFAGTGTTGEAAWREGFRAILIERETEYQADIRRRMALCLAGPEERKRESIAARTKDKPRDAGPLFSEAAT